MTKIFTSGSGAGNARVTTNSLHVIVYYTHVKAYITHPLLHLHTIRWAFGYFWCFFCFFYIHASEDCKPSMAWLSSFIHISTSITQMIKAMTCTTIIFSELHLHCNRGKPTGQRWARVCVYVQYAVWCAYVCAHMCMCTPSTSSLSTEGSFSSSGIWCWKADSGRRHMGHSMARVRSSFPLSGCSGVQGSQALSFVSETTHKKKDL